MKNIIKVLTKDFLIKEYIINKKSTWTIVKQTGYSYTTIRTYLTKYNIKMRNPGGSSKGKILEFSKLRRK